MDKKLFLIDGHSLIFKMYYALLRRPMINSKGEDMSILYGFTKYILELIDREKPTHFAVAFDPPGGTFRNRMYAPYKANRMATPQLVIDALEPLTELCGALGIPVLMVPDYEADDVIGTVASKTAGQGFIVYMVTPDKDYGQLVTDRILQLRPGKGGGDDEVLGPAEICAKYGIHSPSEVIDILTVCGDASDNVPGVKGVGEVGARKLVGKYGSVQNIYAHLDELPPRQKEAFEAARDHIALSRELVTICREVPLEIDTEKMAVTKEYDPKVVELFDRYEFESLKKYISHIAGTVEPKKGAAFSFREVGPAEAAGIARKAGRCSVIVESAGEGIFAGIRNVYIGIASGGECCAAVCSPTGAGEDAAGTVWDSGAGDDAAGTVWAAAEEGSSLPGEIAGLLADDRVEKTGYDLKRQGNVLLSSGIALNGRLLDIELMHYLIDPERSHKLELLARTYLDIDMEEQKGGRELSLFDDAQEDESADRKRRLKEAAVTALLCDRVYEDLRRIGADEANPLLGNGLAGLYDEIEEPLIRVLGDMEREGVRVDVGQLRQIASGMGAQLEKIQQNIRDMAGEPDLNVMSTKQIGIVLFEKLALDPKVKKATDGRRYSYSTDEDTLTALADRHPIINEILEYRGIRKLLSTYLEPLGNYISPRTGKIHTTFNQALTATGRLSSSKPNLQNIPVRTERGREIRKAFVPSLPDGVILSADYSQIELRIMAHLSGDEHMVRAFREGTDIHAMTAARIFGTDPQTVTPDQRRMAKTANFGMIYGISVFGLAQRLKIPRPMAKRIIDDYFANFPAVQSFMDKAVEAARTKGYAETLFGRRRYLPDINARNATVRSNAERNAVNAPVQGTAADIIKKAMVGVARRVTEAGLRSRMVLQVHDELVFDAWPDEAETLKTIVTEEMENVIQLSVPLTVDCNYGKNWLEAH